MPTTIVLVHGAMHTPWVFDPLRAELTERHLESVAIQLPSSDPDSAETGGLSDDVEAIRTAIAEIDGDVVLAAHSYGAVPSTWAAAESDAVVGLALIAGFSLPEGSSLQEFLGGEFPPHWRQSTDGLAFKVGDPEESIFSGVDEALTTEAVGRLNWQGIGAFTEALGARPGDDVKTAYIVTTEDRSLPLEAQEQWAAEADLSVRVASGHSPHLSHPAEVADAIAQLVELTRD